jgi:hypothetical protein
MTKSKTPVYFTSDNVLEHFYDTIASGNSRKLLRVHIPMSDVFYAREAYYQHSGEWVSLDRMERAMYLEGFLKASDVHKPNVQRDWELQPTEQP